MVGSYLNKKDRIEKFLEDWISKVISGRLWEKFYDLHIDKIDRSFRDKKDWISGGLFLLAHLMSLIDISKYDAILAIPLSYVSAPSSSIFTSLKSLDNELDLTPPSFYLFPKGEKNYEQTIKSSEYLEELSKQERLEIFYYEEQEGVDEFARIIYVKLKMKS